MKLISKGIFIDNLIGGEADFLLSPNEACEEQRIMEKIRMASLDACFSNNIKALLDLDYRRDITLDDGRIITNAWCKNLTQQLDGTFVATYAFKNILNKEDFKSAIDTMLDWKYEPKETDTELSEEVKNILKNTKF